MVLVYPARGMLYHPSYPHTVIYKYTKPCLKIKPLGS